MSATSTRPAHPAPGVTRRPTMSPWKVTVRSAWTARALDAAGVRCNAGGHVECDQRADVGGHPLHGAARGLAQGARCARPEQGVDHEHSCVRRRRGGLERLDADADARGDRSHDRRVGRTGRDRARGEHPHRQAGLGQVARHHHPVAAVVARPDHHERIADIRETVEYRPRGGQAGPLHQDDRRDGVLLARPAVGLAHGAGVEERGAARQGRRVTGTGDGHAASSHGRGPALRVRSRRRRTRSPSRGRA